jgi:integrase
MTRKKKRTIARFGTHGASARVFIERGGDLVRVQWRQQGALKTQSWPNTPEYQDEARAFAQTVAHELGEAQAPRARLTVRQLWAMHSQAEFPRLRPRTCALRSADWRKWEAFVGSDTIAEDIGRDKMVEFKAELEAIPLGVNTIRETIKSVKLVYAWGVEHEVLRRDRLAPYKYKVAKDKRPAPVEEYRQPELVALLQQLPLDDGRTWRAHGVLAVCGYQGARQWSVLHLRKADIDLEQGILTWRAEWDKNGVTWTQPLRPQTRAVLAVCLRRSGESEWVFPAGNTLNKGAVYTAQSLWCSLVAAEKRAGITHKRNRGAHGLRRLLAGEVMALTGNLKDAADAIGDKSLKVVEKSYLVKRDDRVREVFGMLDSEEENTRNRNPNSNDGEAGSVSPLTASAPGRTRTCDPPLTPVSISPAEHRASPEDSGEAPPVYPPSDGEAPPQVATETATQTVTRGDW